MLALQLLSSYNIIKFIPPDERGIRQINLHRSPRLRGHCPGNQTSLNIILTPNTDPGILRWRSRTSPSAPCTSWATAWPGPCCPGAWRCSPGWGRTPGSCISRWIKIHIKVWINIHIKVNKHPYQGVNKHV